MSSRCDIQFFNPISWPSGREKALLNTADTVARIAGDNVLPVLSHEDEFGRYSATFFKLASFLFVVVEHESEPGVTTFYGDYSMDTEAAVSSIQDALNYQESQVMWVQKEI